MAKEIKEIPEYKRTEKITPSGGVTGISSAFAPAINNALTQSQFGADLAVKAAIQYGIQEGQAAGHAQPGRELLPAFTAADKAYVQAYHQEEFNTLSANADSGIKGLAFEALKNPSTHSLQSYQSNAQQLIQQLLAQSSKENRFELERSLTHAYDSNFYHIAGAVEQENKRVLRENFEQSYLANKDALLNYQLQGFGQAAKDTLQSTLKSIAGAADLSPADRQRLSKDAIEQYHAGALIREVDEARKAGGYDAVDKVLSDLATRNLEGLNPLEQGKVAGTVLGYVGKQRQLQADAHRTEVAQIEHAIVTGDIQNQEQLDSQLDKLTTYEYLQLDEKLQRVQEQRTGSAALRKAIAGAVAKDDGSINNFNADEIQKFYNSSLESIVVQNKGQPPTLEQQAQLVAKIGRPVESFTNFTNNSVLRGTTEQAVEAINQLGYISKASPDAFEIKNPQVRAIFEMVSRDLASGVPADESLARAKESWKTNVKDSELIQKQFESILSSPNEEIKNKFNKLFGLGTFGYGGIKNAKNGVGAYIKPYNAFVRKMNDYFLATNDIDTAYAATKRDMESQWGESPYAIDPIMQYPPEKAIPNAEIGEWFWNQQGFQLSLLAQTYGPDNKHIQYAGKQSKDQNALFEERIYDNKLVIDGQPRDVKWRANPFSGSNTTIPIYYAYYTDDFGVIQPLTLPDGRPFSWQPVSLTQYLPKVGEELETKADASKAQAAARQKYKLAGVRGSIRFGIPAFSSTEDSQTEELLQMQKFADETQAELEGIRKGKLAKGSE